MKIKTQHVRMILVCLLVMAAMSPDISAQGKQSDSESQGKIDAAGQKDKDENSRVPWQKETALKRHMLLTRIKGSRRIEIHPVRQAEGISTGLVIAYGHIIPPPYKIEFQGG